jgi:hypothetical protein
VGFPVIVELLDASSESTGTLATTLTVECAVRLRA